MLKEINVFVAKFMTPFHICTKFVNRSQGYLMPKIHKVLSLNKIMFLNIFIILCLKKVIYNTIKTI